MTPLIALLRAIARGAGWKLASDLLGRLIQYTLLWAAARTLGQADFGDFTFALSTGLMLAQVADFGLQIFVQRELSRLVRHSATGEAQFSDRRAAGRLVGGGLAIKGALSVVALVLMAVLLAAEPVSNKGALLVVGLSMVLGTTLEYFMYCFRALGKLQLEAIAGLVARGVNLLLGVALLLAGVGVMGLAVAGVAAMLVGIAVLYVRLRAYVRPVWSLDWPFWRKAFTQPTAIGIGVIFSIISFRVDNLLIPPFAGREALGVYNVAYKLFEPSLILPGVLLAATFPLLSRASGTDQRQGRGGGRALTALVGQNLTILAVLGVGVTLSLILLAGPVLQVLYGAQYAASAPVLQILALACLPMYFNYALTHTLIAMDRPRLYAVFTLAALGVNVALNAAAIPRFGIAGAAWATVATEGALLALCAASIYLLLFRRPGFTKPEAAAERGVGGSL